MNCLRCQELLSDHIEGALAPPLASELHQHLASCPGCTELLGSFRGVLEILSSARAPDPPPGLTERILARTLPRLTPGNASRDRVRTSASRLGSWPTAASWLAAAAVFVLVFVWRPPEIVSDWSREVTSTARQVYSFGVRTVNDAERWVAELNVLRMTVGVAFEDRLDRLNERIRALEKARRSTTDEDTDSSSRARPGERRAHRSAIHKRSFV